MGHVIFMAEGKESWGPHVALGTSARKRDPALALHPIIQSRSVISILSMAMEKLSCCRKG